MEQDQGVPASPSGCQPTAAAAEEASSRSGIPNAVPNTDRELWRDGDDYYADSIFVTETGGIGISVLGASVMVKSPGAWRHLPNEIARLSAGLAAFPNDVATVLMQMGDGEYCQSAKWIADDLGLAEKRVQEIHRALKTLGFAHCGTLMTDEGAVCGRGYWASASGEAFANALAIAMETGTAIDSEASVVAKP